MKSDSNLTRFLDAQTNDYTRAFTEIRNGRKQSHWMWYVFPQIAGLGFSETAKFYAVKDLQEARAYLEHPILGSRLIEITTAFLHIPGKTANQILGTPDDLKMRSSMTLFSLADPENSVFQAVLTKYFNGVPDQRTGTIVTRGE